MKYCLIIPHYNHHDQFLAFLPTLEAVGLDCVIVDDGSDAISINALENYVENKPSLHLYKHPRNRGKGAAVKTGLLNAGLLGFTHAVQIDADGQHNTLDIQAFVAASRQKPQAIICGRPIFDNSAPKIRLHGRKITTFWVCLETLSNRIKDGLCGFRVYPLAMTEKIIDRYFLGSRMDFDTEILVKAVWYNVELHFINTAVIYPEHSISHFQYLRDNLNLIRLHTRLMLGMLVRLPLLLLNHLRGPRR
jgi:glycosyltransferase involved in cell wall biosynthesis